MVVPSEYRWVGCLVAHSAASLVGCLDWKLVDKLVDWMVGQLVESTGGCLAVRTVGRMEVMSAVRMAVLMVESSEYYLAGPWDDCSAVRKAAYWDES